VDTTGAGDLYAAGFLYGLIQDYPLAVCGRIGSLLSGKVVEVVGAKLAEAQWREVEAALPAMVS
jgi:sugar/nucleoside kinase (ribokinase family)